MRHRHLPRHTCELFRTSYGAGGGWRPPLLPLAAAVLITTLWVGCCQIRLVSEGVEVVVRSRRAPTMEGQYATATSRATRASCFAPPTALAGAGDRRYYPWRLPS